jgi:20S proteasome alpha/beta subunit
MYEYEHNKNASTPAIAQLLSTMLYNRRFFPYYVNTIVAGLSNDGKGAIFSYDPVGSYEREIYRAAGSSSALLQPLLQLQDKRVVHLVLALLSLRHTIHFCCHRLVRLYHPGQPLTQPIQVSFQSFCKMSPGLFFF